MFHIADAPCHGTEFHCGLDDRYPGGDPSGRSMKILFEEINRNKIQYCFGTITTNTDIMYKKFSSVYNGEIAVCDLKNARFLAENVLSWSSIGVTRGREL